MSLLEEIRDAAVDEKSDLGTLLRRCKVLASKFESQPLEDWLSWESNGYPKDIEVPPYRTFPILVKGHFVGYGGGKLNAITVPMACLPEEAKKFYESHSDRSSITTIQSLVRHKEGGKGKLTVSTGDLKIALHNKVYEGYTCLEVWGEIGESALIEILNSVRNRILDFVLAIEKQEIKASSVDSQNHKQIGTDKVTQIFNMTIYNSGSANIVGNASESSVGFTLQPLDFTTLKKLLFDHNIEEADIGELQQAIASDEKPTQKEKFGPHVSNWLGGMVKKAAEGSWKIGISTAGHLLTEALTKYYGLK